MQREQYLNDKGEIITKGVWLPRALFDYFIIKGICKEHPTRATFAKLINKEFGTTIDETGRSLEIKPKDETKEKELIKLLQKSI